ncbi:septation protein A [Taklimakanibacter lacteus]|uniref:septation protein A n=1 Tax=Taklimakanibacter lacteus TaxID=2268456 RepID=UPI000E6690B9
MNPVVKILIEAGPLVAFFLTNWLAGIFWGTGIFMIATAVALILSWLLTRKLAVMPLISAGFVAVFGILTLWLHDETFIKVKVTLINALFGVVLLGGLFFGQTFLKFVMGEALKMTDEGWRALTIRWGIFFLCVAVVNEVVWRSVSTDTWVNFKVALLPITLVFALSQAPMMTKHMIQDDPKPPH